MTDPYIAIIDYGLGNLFSVKHACTAVGISSHITADIDTVLGASAVILPGVGAYGDAMNTLHKLDLVRPLQDFAQSGKPFVGICLGQQLVMTESHEFGVHKGLGLIDGIVIPFEEMGNNEDLPPQSLPRPLKRPQIAWNRIENPRGADHWANTPLNGLASGDYMYFVHSFYVQPQDESTILACSKYGNIAFCSSLQRGNIFTCQFHPERSGVQGLRIYQNLVQQIHATASIQE